MKQQTEKISSQNQHSSYYHFLIERVHIKVKFSCRLYLEYSLNQESVKSKEIRIQQKSKTYQFGEEVKMLINDKVSSFQKGEGELIMQVKLLSSKGLAFTAGIVTIPYNEFKQFNEIFQVRFNKSQDFDVWCQCRKMRSESSRIGSQKGVKNGDYSKAESLSMTDKKNKEGGSDFDRESVKKSQQLISSKGENLLEEGRKSIISLKASQLRVKNQIQNFDSRNGSKQLLQKIEALQCQLHKNTVLFQKQRDIISMLQLKQAEYNEEKLQLKNTIRVMQIDTDEKRQKIRQLQGQKIKLLMNNLQMDRENGTTKQKTLSLLEKSSKQIKLFLNEKINKIAADFTDKTATNYQQISSLSKINNKISESRMARNIEDNNSKVIFSTVRGLISKDGSHNWLEQSIGGKEVNPSFMLSNTFNDMSISDINGRLKEVSLMNSDLFCKLNNDLFCKIPENQQRNASNQSHNKNFLEQIVQQIQKLQKMIEVKIGKICSIFVQLIQKSKNAGGRQNESAQSSLLGYLQQLQTGFEKQIGALSQKQKIMSYYEQVIEQLNKNLYQKQNLVVQLQQQLFKLEEEKDQIKSELHESNYAHAIKQEQYLKKIHLLEYGTNPPDYSSSASPTRKPITKRKQHKKVTAHYEQQLIEYKQHLRTMQIELLHERDEKSKLVHSLHAKQIELQEILIEKRRLQFSAKLRERMTSLNESIELSIEQQVESKPRDNEKYTQESLGAHEYGDRSLEHD